MSNKWNSYSNNYYSHEFILQSHLVLFASRQAAILVNKLEKSRRDKIWRDNPQIRKLVPKPRCPICRKRLDPGNMDSSSESDSESETAKNIVACVDHHDRPEMIQPILKKVKSKTSPKKVVTFVEDETPRAEVVQVNLNTTNLEEGRPNKLPFVQNFSKEGQKVINTKTPVAEFVLPNY